MLESLWTLAIVPKAKSLGAQRLSMEDYRELMRRRSVLEVFTTLQNHPYFQKTLGGLSQTGLHRAQVEDALSKDVFFKYENLMRYSFRKEHFGSFFLVRCEIDELLHKLRLMDMGVADQYIIRLPGFLTTKTSFSLLKLAKATTLDECIHLTAGTPYSRLLQSVKPPAGQRMDYLDCECAFKTYYYTWVLRHIRADVAPRMVKDTSELFRREAEIYNLDLLFRAKAFYPTQFTPARLRALLLPVEGVLSTRAMHALADTRNVDEFLQQYNGTRAAAVYGKRSADPQDADDVHSHRALYRKAESLLHFSSKPQAVLAAVLFLAELERSNIITVIEGVRYGLAPDRIESFLKR